MVILQFHQFFPHCSFHLKANEKEEKIHYLNEELLQEPDYTFFMFINPISGSKQAVDLLKLQVEKYCFKLDSNQEGSQRKLRIEIYMYDLTTQSIRERGFSFLRLKQESGTQNIRVIACGGDGSVMWVIQEMMDKGCDLCHTPIGTAPFGTGNDFSRVTNWGHSMNKRFLGKDMEGIQKMAEKWVNAKIAPFDIWDCQIKANQDGHFEKVELVNGVLQKKIMLDSNGEKITRILKNMSNYFSIGVDARVGVGFDKHRTNSQSGNKWVYCWEGFKKMFFISTKKMNSVLDAVEMLQMRDIEQNRLADIDLEHDDFQGNRQIIFSTRNAQFSISQQQLQDKDRENLERKKEYPILKGNPANLLIQNISSYAAGSNRVWNTSKGKIGIESFSKKKKIPENFQSQDFGDGKLEFVSFPSLPHITLERFIGGMAKRVEQNTGPYLITFQKSIAKEGNNPVVTYFQIDGEYYKIISPQAATVQLNTHLQNGQIKVLINTMGNSY